MSSAYDPRITAYFGDAVLRAGFMPTPHLFLRHYAQLGLGHGEAMFVLQLMEINWDLAAPPKTVNEIAQRMGVNARTVRRYSEVVADLGLVTLYDQYDDSGAQVENGYDLSPLFARLAAFAPEPPLGGQARRRERRAPSGSASAQQHEYPAASARSKRAADKSVSLPPDKSVSLPPDKPVTPSPDNADKGSPDESITGPLIDLPGLKKEKRIPQEQKIMMHDALSSAGSGEIADKPQSAAGWSLRQERPLLADDVAQTDDILQRIGIDLPVRSRIRASMGPAEAWTLWAYALAKRWSIPLLINAVYDKVLRQARPAALPTHYDSVGILLTQLNPDRAEQLIALVAEHCPDTSMLPFMELLGTPPAPAILTALEAVWNMIAELRKASGKPSPVSAFTTSQAAPALPHATTWTAVLEGLAGQISPREFTTWLQETTLLELEATTAFVGASNVFARERIEATYLDAIQQTLSAVLGRSVRVQVVIAAPANGAASTSSFIRNAL